MGGSSKKVTVGYKYYGGMHMVLCHGPVDKIIRIMVDKRTAWIGHIDHGNISINAPNLFGGEPREGGISGSVDILSGKPDQGRNSYLQNKLGNAVPAFRGVMSVVLRKCYLGNNPYLKPWSFRAQRIHTRQNGVEQWFDAASEIPYKDYGPILEGPWDYKVIPYHSNPGYNNLTPPADWDGRAELPFNDSHVWVYPTPPGWPTPNLSICWVRKTLYNVPEGVTIQLRADNGCMLWLNGQYIGASNRDNIPIGANQQYPVNFIVPARGTYEIIGKAFSEEETRDQAGNVLSITISDVAGGADMNPAHIIRECLTDPDWGMGYNEDDIDNTSFVNAALTLLIEGMGMSLLWDKQMGIESFIQEIVKHIDGALYVDRYTGRFVLKLIRYDYNPDDLLILDENNIDKITNYSRPVFGELTNSVTVNYWDTETNTDASVTVQDIALAHMQQATINTTIQYPGFTNKRIATLVAQRDLKSLSTPLISCTIYATSEASVLTIGDVFKLTWPDYGVVGVVMRITGIAYGDGKTNRVQITATQDVFSLPDTLVVTPPDVEWEDPSEAPRPLMKGLVFEVPYLELVQQNGQTVVDQELEANPEAGYIGAAAIRPQSGAINARLMVNDGPGFEDVGGVDFCGGAVLDANVPLLTTNGEVNGTFPIRDLTDAENITAGEWCQIGTEILAVESVTETELVLRRGCLDTVPVPHFEGEVVYFWDAYGQIAQTEYVQSDEVDVRLLTATGQGLQDLTTAPNHAITVRGRAARPYPPANFKVNGAYWPQELIGSTLTLTWVERNRLQQTGGNLLDFTDATVTPEAGTSYEVDVYQLLSDNSEILEISAQAADANDEHELDLSGVSWDADAYGFRVELWSKRDGLRSWQCQSASVYTLTAPYNLKGEFIPAED